MTSIVSSAAAIAEFGDDTQRADWAAPAARGEKIMKAALSEEWGDTPALPFTRANRTETGWELTGTKIVVDGYQSKDGSRRANGRDLTLPNGQTLFLGSSGTGAPYEKTEKK